jgi:hypothetical protein
MLLNADGDDGTLEQLILRRFVRPASAAPASSAALASDVVAGYYERDDSRLAFGEFIDRFAGSLVEPHAGGFTLAPIGGERTAYTAVARNRFRSARSLVPDAAFATTADEGHVLVTPYAFYRRVSPAWPLIRAALLCAALALLAAALVAAIPLAIVALLRHRWARVRHIVAMCLPSLVLIALALCFAVLRETLQPRSWSGVGFYAAGLLLPGSVAGPLLAARLEMRRGSRALARFALIVGIAASAVAAYLALHGIIGFRPWAAY